MPDQEVGILFYRSQVANKVFQSRKCHGRCVIGKLPLAAVGLFGWGDTRLETKRPGRELVMEIKLGDGEILGLGDLVMPPTELVVIGAGLERRTSTGWRTLWAVQVAVVNRRLDVWAWRLRSGSHQYFNGNWIHRSEWDCSKRVKTKVTWGGWPLRGGRKENPPARAEILQALRISNSHKFKFSEELVSVEETLNSFLSVCFKHGLL